MSWCVYVQFNNSYDGKAGYVGEWKPGYMPVIIALNETYWYNQITFFPSKNAAVAFAERLVSAFEDEIKYWEITNL